MVAAPTTNLADVARRIDERLAELGITGREASRRAGLSADAVRNIHRAIGAVGRKGVTLRTLTALAPVLHTSVSWLLNEKEDQAMSEERATKRIDSEFLRPEHLPDPRTRRVPVKGYVGAGGATHFYALDDGDLDEVLPPSAGGEKTVAVEIRGKSLGAILDHALAFYDEVRTPPTPDLIGRLCVVGLDDGRILIKKLMPAKTPGRFSLHSEPPEPPIENAAIEWAARVISIRPR